MFNSPEMFAGIFSIFIKDGFFPGLINSRLDVHLCPEMHTITKFRRQFDDFYNFGKYGDCGEFLSNHQMYVNQFHTWWPAMYL